MAYILEETKGNLPVWLAPVQIKVLPVKNDDETLLAYAREVTELFEDEGFRVELDDRSEKLGYRMREGQMQKVPYLLVLGNNEVNDRTVTYRLHGRQETTTVALDEFVKMVGGLIDNKKFAE